MIVNDTKAQTLMPLISHKIKPDSIVYTDSYSSYDILDASIFHHERINHSTEFVDGKTTSRHKRISGAKPKEF